MFLKHMEENAVFAHNGSPTSKRIGGALTPFCLTTGDAANFLLALKAPRTR